MKLDIALPCLCPGSGGGFHGIVERAGQQAEPRACKTDHVGQQLLAPQQPQISITETGS